MPDPVDEVLILIQGLSNAQRVELHTRLVAVRLSYNIDTIDATDSIQSLGLSVRARKVICMALEPRGLEYPNGTIADLAALSLDDLMSVRNCGRMTVREINQALSMRGLSLKPSMYGAELDRA